MGDYPEYRDGWQVPRASDVRVIHADGTEEIKPRNSFIVRSRAGRELRKKNLTNRTRSDGMKTKRRARLWR
jgi:hypothetical protein